MILSAFQLVAATRKPHLKQCQCDSNAKALMMKLSDYGTDPFLGVARDLATGKEIDVKILAGGTKASALCNTQFKKG